VVVGNHVNPSGELKQVRVCETTKSKNGNRLEADEQSELVRLRQLAYQLANQLAHAHGMGHLIKPLSEQGLGFVVQDVPDETHTEVPDEDLARLVTAVWWQLVACSEVMVAPSVQVVAQLKEGSSFQIAIADQAPNQLFAAMSPLEPGLVGSHLWRWGVRSTTVACLGGDNGNNQRGGSDHCGIDVRHPVPGGGGSIGAARDGLRPQGN
jgi:hypothetical protein